MKKMILMVTAIAISLTCSFAGNENASSAKVTDAIETKCPEMDDQTIMSLQPFATRNSTAVNPLDASSLPTTFGGRVYFSTSACRTWWLSQPLPSGATNDTYFDAGGSAEWNSFLIACPF
jgi:hypothetical protein